MTDKSLASAIDHTALRPETTIDQIVQLCNEADSHGFASVCVMPYYVPVASRALEELGSAVRVCTTIGFPSGLHQSVIKVAETVKAIHDGAHELDMVINVGALKSGQRAVVMADILAVTMAAHARGTIVKVILETVLLTDGEKRLACELAGEAAADFVKTSTGFFGGGATVEDIRLMREATAPAIGIKASGGVRTRAMAIAMMAAGASRIGTSAGVMIMNERAAAAP